MVRSLLSRASSRRDRADTRAGASETAWSATVVAIGLVVVVAVAVVVGLLIGGEVTWLAIAGALIAYALVVSQGRRLTRLERDLEDADGERVGVERGRTGNGN